MFFKKCSLCSIKLNYTYFRAKKLYLCPRCCRKVLSHSSTFSDLIISAFNSSLSKGGENK